MPDTNYRRPETVEELTMDLDNHPDRGKLNGQEVVRFDLKEFSGMIPHGLAARALESGAPFGFTRDEILIAALTMWTSDPGIQQARITYQQELAEKYDTPVSKVRSKIRGAYKKVRRVGKLNALQSTNASVGSNGSV
jgi:hypothetical protein